MSRLIVVTLLGGKTVPLVDRDHQCTPGFQHEAGQMRVLLGNVLARIEHQHHHVGVLDRLQGLDDGELLHRLEHLALAAHAGGVDQDVGLAVALELDVDRVARGARLVERDHAFLANQGIDQSRLADVGAPHQRDLGNAEFVGFLPLRETALALRPPDQMRRRARRKSPAARPSPVRELAVTTARFMPSVC
jgi:hypothetical protein